MSLSDAAFGLWAGTAVNDTSSVVATGYAFSEAAGDFATMVADAHTRHHPDGAGLRRHQRAPQEKGRRAKRRPWRQGQYEVPWFILGFLAMSILCSVGVIPAGLATTLKSISKFLMVAALAAIGLNTNFAALCKSGAKPMLHGFIISLLVVLVAIAVEYVLGIARRAARSFNRPLRKDEIAAVRTSSASKPKRCSKRDPAVEKLLYARAHSV